LLATKLHPPAPRRNAVLRPRLNERMSRGLERKLTLVSAPAGFGKTSAIGEWLATVDRPVAWLSLDDYHKDPALFLAYLTAAVQTIMPLFGASLIGALRSTQPP